MPKSTGLARLPLYGIDPVHMCPAPILVIDDDDGMREPLCRMLEFDGHRTVGVANGREALQKLRGGLDPCIIITDLMMPELDGFAFRKAQLANPRLADIPTIVLTASTLTVGAEVIGATAVVSKPVTVGRVLALVDAYCRPRDLPRRC